MIIILKPDCLETTPAYRETLAFLSNLPGIEARIHQVQGTRQQTREIYLLGDTSTLSIDEISHLPAVVQVIRVSEEYRILGKNKSEQPGIQFSYQGMDFSQDSFHIFAGLCAVDTSEHTESMMKALQEQGQHCTRMGAYKPRTSPYSFQGHGNTCLPYVFELAGKYDIRVIAMEVTHEQHIEEIKNCLEQTGSPTGVMLQIGTRNIQNFELLKAVGKQQEFPILVKRGFGITLEESLHAVEYLASSGNSNIIFCLRGMKSNFSEPHRNLVDFCHVPALKRMTRMPICIDPSHAVGGRERGHDAILDLFHVTFQGVAAGANMVLVDFHPAPHKALVDGPQALSLTELPWFLEETMLARETYQKRMQLAKKYAL